MKKSLATWGIAVLTGCTLLFMPSCSDDYDDNEIKERLDKVEDKVAQLQEWCTTVNSEITSLKGLVTALESNDYVTGVETLENGYKITFSKSGSITILNGKDGTNGTDGKNGTNGKDGVNGKDGITPIIGAAKYTDGLYYWTIQTEEGKINWLVDADGNMIRTTGDNGKDGTDGKDGAAGNNGDNAPIPVLKTGLELGSSYIPNAIYLSIDGSQNWVKVSGEQGEKGEQGVQGPSGPEGPSGAACSISHIEVKDNNVIFTLGTGNAAQTLTIPFYTPILTITGNKEITENGNLFTIKNDILKRTDLVIQTRVESESADGTDFLITRSTSNRWNVESSLSTDNTGTLSITVTPASGIVFHEPALLKVTVSTKDGQLLASGQQSFTNGIFMGTLCASSLEDLSQQLEELDPTKTTDIRIMGNVDDYEEDYWREILSSIGAFTEIGTLDISIPQITTLPSKVFYEKKNLKAFKSANITALHSNGSQFQRSSVEEVNLPNLQSLNETDFSDCLNLHKVDVSGVTTVKGSQVFSHCEKLKVLNLPNLIQFGNKNYANFARGCYLLEEVNMPKVTSLPNNAFTDCFSLKNINFPEVTTLGGGVFSNCHSLASISLPKVTELPSNTFSGCSSLTKIQTGTTDLKNLTQIGNSAFQDCTSLITVIMFNVSAIGNKAFSNCKSLTTVSLAGGGMTVATDAFDGVNTEQCTLKLMVAPTNDNTYNKQNKKCYGKTWKMVDILR